MALYPNTLAMCTDGLLTSGNVIVACYPISGNISTSGSIATSATDNIIYLYRKDSFQITCTITDADGTAIDLTGYTLYLTVKKDGRDNTTEIGPIQGSAPPTGISVFDLSITDTDIDFGEYVYDVQYSNMSEKHTVIKSKLHILGNDNPDIGENKITIYKGDSKSIEATLTDQDGAVIDLTTYAVTFRAKEDMSNTANIIAEISGTNPATGITVIDLSSIHTNIESKIYYYDIIITKTDVQNTIIRDILEIKEDVTN